MTEQVLPETRPAGTSALIYGVIALAVGGVVTPVAMLVFSTLGVLVGGATLVAGVVALVTGIVKRLAGGSQAAPPVGRLALIAAVPALAALVLGIVLNVLG